ncbi:hypothetical protein [Pelagibius sp.]|uniref:hypothetical protein n=1 Tax=Pelagibius sp. TaxID=1931238 RepID=UPI00262DD267|nr:hypothetical protein [Pelagibius sp.]
MSQTEELEDLARRYVDLWQDQMTALAADPDFAEAMQRVMASLGVTAAGLPAVWGAWPAAMASMLAAAQGGPPAGLQAAGLQAAGLQAAGAAKAGGPEKDGARNGRREDVRGNDGSAGPAGPAPAAAASDGGGADLGVIAERLAALEQRILALEGGTGRPRRKPKAKTGGG